MPAADQSVNVPDRLRRLADDVRRLGAAWRGDPETTFERKEAVVVELRQIARELDGGARR